MVPYLQRNWRKKFISVSGVDLGGNFFHWTLRKTCSWKSSQLSQLLFSILRAFKPDLTTTRSFLTWILLLTSNIKFRMNQPYIHCSQWCWVLHEHTKRDIFALTKSLGFEEKNWFYDCPHNVLYENECLSIARAVSIDLSKWCQNRNFLNLTRNTSSLRLL